MSCSSPACCGGTAWGEMLLYLWKNRRGSRNGIWKQHRWWQPGHEVFPRSRAGCCVSVNRLSWAAMLNSFTAQHSQKIWLPLAPSAGFLVFIALLQIHPYRLICDSSLIALNGGCQDKNTEGLCTCSSETQQGWERCKRSRSPGNYLVSSLQKPPPLGEALMCNSRGGSCIL